MIPAMAVHHVPHRQPGGARRLVLICLAGLLALGFLMVPMAVIFAQALSKGWAAWWAAISHPETLHAIGLSLLVVAVVVPINAVYGLAVAWTITKFRFRGAKWLISLVEAPFSVSPIVAGVAALMVYGGSGLLGPWLEEHDIKVMFALPGIIIATLFVTSPFIARELLPLMQLQGTDDEEAALTLGAGGFSIFLRVTLPNVKWALYYGIILCAARSLGEFGAVSVVSGQVRGETMTLPLQIDLLYHDYDSSGAFAAASVLTLLALVTLVLKLLVERFYDREIENTLAERKG
ncbi:Sulfate transport system permease protein CysW [Paramagnetospirillum magnetotacticum MS-1]|uniref:Sulfate transport system permease protein CysW n=1 Tax=Paramagnetospirillum magnetotacticum MS-1 TaxID=272627 RepID=A0A0C2UCQ6_PARME|nr:sulfate ABC transporter permease subunit CysW [Paramagnetospirillum magnetotacticum]KIL99297.1 Sulfate transport system permease protein CysW [Paramagnetospirillum magnetotacticum MS-1]